MKFPKLFLLSLIGIIIIAISCQKDNDDINNNTPAEFTITTGTDMLLNGKSTVVYGKLRMTSGTVSEYGFCWSEYQNPTIESDQSTNLGTTNESEEFSAELDGLKMSTNYFLRTYAKDATGITYGNEIAFRTSDININEIVIWEYTPTSLTLAVLLDVSTIDPVQYGFCWDTDDNPLVTDHKIESENINSDKIFFAKISNLEPDQNYYFRAYSVMGGVLYSKVKEISLPSYKIKNLTVEQTGNFSVEVVTQFYNNNNPINDYGICYSLTENPEITDSLVSLGLNVSNEEVTIIINDLTADENYYFRGYMITKEDSVIYSIPTSYDLAFPLSIPDYPGYGLYSPVDFKINDRLFYGICRDSYTQFYEFDLQEIRWIKKANMPFNVSIDYYDNYNESHTSNKNGYFFYRSYNQRQVSAGVYLPDEDAWEFMGTLSFSKNITFMSSIYFNEQALLLLGFYNTDYIEIYELQGFNQFEKISEIEYDDYLQFSFSIEDLIYMTNEERMFTYNLNTQEFVEKNGKPVYSYSPYYYDENWAHYFKYNNEQYLSAQEKVYKYLPQSDEWKQMNDFDGFSDESTSIIVNNNIFIGMGVEESKFILYKPE